MTRTNGDTSANNRVKKSGDTMSGPLSISQNAAAVTPLELVNNTNTTASTELYFVEMQQNSSDAFLFRRKVDASTGHNDFRNVGATNAPPINTLVAPNGIDYSDWTFDGTNTELETSTGDLNLRPNLNGVVDYTGNVNIWSTGHTPKLRIGNNGFSAALDIYHDGGNAHLSSTTGGINVDSAANLQKLNVVTGSNKSAGTGTLSGGTATISTTAVTANSLIFLTDTASSLTNVGVMSVTSKSAGTSFTVTSTNVLDTSTFNWLIIN